MVQKREQGRVLKAECGIVLHRMVKRLKERISREEFYSILFVIRVVGDILISSGKSGSANDWQRLQRLERTVIQRLEEEESR